MACTVSGPGMVADRSGRSELVVTNRAVCCRHCCTRCRRNNPLTKSGSAVARPVTSIPPRPPIVLLPAVTPAALPPARAAVSIRQKPSPVSPRKHHRLVSSDSVMIHTSVRGLFGVTCWAFGNSHGSGTKFTADEHSTDKQRNGNKKSQRNDAWSTTSAHSRSASGGSSGDGRTASYGAGPRQHRLATVARPTTPRLEPSSVSSPESSRLDMACSSKLVVSECQKRRDESPESDDDEVR